MYIKIYDKYPRKQYSSIKYIYNYDRLESIVVEFGTCMCVVASSNPAQTNLALAVVRS